MRRFSGTASIILKKQDNHMINEFTISGLHCESCLKLVPLLLREIKGVKDVRISGLDGHVVLKADEVISRQAVEQALAGTDYKVS